MRDVLLRAAAWFERHDRIDDAIRHLLRADEASAAAAPAAVRGGLVLRARRCRRLPDARRTAAHAQVEPQLAIVLAYAAATSGHLDRVSHWLDICDPRIGPGTVVRDWRHPRAAALMIRALIGLPDTESARAVELCGQAVALESDSPGREIALWPVSHSMIINVLTADWSMRWTLSTVPFSVCVSTTSNRARIDSITDCATALIDRHFAVLFKAHVLHRVSSRCPIGTTMNRTGVAAQHPG
jgi:hypothetical protein